MVLVFSTKPSCTATHWSTVSFHSIGLPVGSIQHSTRLSQLLTCSSSSHAPLCLGWLLNPEACLSSSQVSEHTSSDTAVKCLAFGSCRQLSGEAACLSHITHNRPRTNTARLNKGVDDWGEYEEDTHRFLGKKEGSGTMEQRTWTSWIYQQQTKSFVKMNCATFICFHPGSHADRYNTEIRRYWKERWQQEHHTAQPVTRQWKAAR